MEKKIEQIQQEVDDLIRLCAEAGAMPQEDQFDLDKNSKLAYLILKYQDGDLEEEHVRLLEEWLLTDSEAMDYYINFQNLNALLYSYFNKDREKRLLEQMQEIISARHGR